jgi:transposase
MAESIKYHIRLSAHERDELHHLISTGKAAASKLMHARILLKVDRGPHGPAMSDRKTAEAVECDPMTIQRVKKRCAEEGIESALTSRPKGHRAAKLDGEQEAKLVALSCSKAPDGRKRWTLQMLADKLVELDVVDSISDESVRRTLKKKRAEAMAKGAVGHSAGTQRRLRSGHGRRPRRVQTAS